MSAEGPPAAPMSLGDVGMASMTKSKLKKTAVVNHAVRKERIAALGKITQTKDFRDGPDEGSPRTPAGRALDMIMQSDAVIPMSELTHVRRLGEGAFATVDLYTRRVGELDVPFAVKVIKEDQMPASERLRFQAEAVLLKSLRHRNVVGCSPPPSLPRTLPAATAPRAADAAAHGQVLRLRKGGVR